MKKQNTQLKDFLARVKQLRGFGDMNSYQVVNEFKTLSNDKDQKIEHIIEDFSNPETYYNGKNRLIKEVEDQLDND
ncbi:hypothetical protein GCM10022246_36640 [Pedobacter ginsengiterrae]|uniref:Uncharacterized protein n=1 Tax=Pedobacter ginsengiterrae TaxID=871696 RepID=A0ABP7QEM0_9SPHI|nr:hypothetical protein [Pedobacter aquatilis]